MLAELIRVSAEGHPDDEVLVQDDRRLTRAQLDRTARGVGAWLVEHGTRMSDRVGIAAQNSVDWMVASTGIDAAGAVVVPMPYRATAKDIAHLVGDAATRIVFVDAAVGSLLGALDGLAPLEWLVGFGAQAVAPPPGAAFVPFADIIATVPMEAPRLDGTMVFYTAGTTGPAKGVYRDTEAMRDAAAFPGLFDLRADDTHLVAGALYHGGPGMFAAISLALSKRVVVLRTFDPEALLALVERERVTTTFMVPTMLRLLTKHPAAVARRYDTSSVRVIVTAGEPCPAALKRDIHELFGPVLYEFGGASELGVLAVMPPGGHDARPGSCGRIVDGQEVAILGSDGQRLGPGEHGEIHARGAGLMTGYWNDQDTTDSLKRDGFMSVGDLGFVDEDNYLYITGRLVDLIKTGGVRVTPVEVEAVLLEHPDVLEAAVIGAPDETWGERIVACILPTPDAEPSADDLRRWCRERLTSQKVPKQVMLFSEEEWPRQGTGKVPKRLLRALLRAKEQQAVEAV